MDRRYYIAKLFLIVVAGVLAIAGGSAGSRMAHALNHQTRYSAPAQVQDAAWHATVRVAKLVTCLASRTLQGFL